MAPRIPLRRTLVVRLTAISVLIAIGSIAATAWLAVTTTTREIQQERGAALSRAAAVYNDLLGFAARNPEWSDAAEEVRVASARSGRRVVLTTMDRQVLADSGGKVPLSLPAEASAVIDPLKVDSELVPDIAPDRVDPRATGPFQLTPDERVRQQTLAAKVTFCLHGDGVRYQVRELPTGRVRITAAPDFDDQVRLFKCDLEELQAPTSTEKAALAQLNDLLRDCLQRQGLPPSTVGLDLTPTSGNDTLAGRSCVDSARRQQLAAFVAPPALLFVLDPATAQSNELTLNRDGWVRIALVVLAVVAVAMLAMIFVSSRLSLPLRGLTAAAVRDERAPVSTHDEIGYLAQAFNSLQDRRQELDEQRRRMVGDIAHELRNPLNTIRGRLEAAEDGLLPLDRGLTSVVLGETLLLQRIVSDLQDLAAADAGQLRLNPEPLHLSDIVDQVVTTHRGVGTARLTGSTAGDPVIVADAARLRQALGNLVSNALRHTPVAGEVTVTAFAEGGEAVITVRDTGPGIDPGDLPHVFDRFWRADRSRARHTGGSGLGLPIVRHLVEAHGGSVTAESPGGALFTVRLPRGTVERTSS
ncbi:sensor histidine kinase [Lentzea sp. NPDC004789]